MGHLQLKRLPEILKNIECLSDKKLSKISISFFSKTNYISVIKTFDFVIEEGNFSAEV